MKQQVYIRCPRCELNYILKKDKYCSVCKAEMQVGGGNELDDLDLELCPICKTNYIQADEIMCNTCMQERKQEDADFSEDSDWSGYVGEEDEFVSPDEETGGIVTVRDIDEEDDILDTDLDLEDEIDFDEEAEEEHSKTNEEDDEDLDDIDDIDELEDDDLDDDIDDEDY